MAAFLLKIRRVDNGTKVSEDSFRRRGAGDSITSQSMNSKIQGILKLTEEDVQRVVKYARSLVPGAATVSGTHQDDANTRVDAFIS